MILKLEIVELVEEWVMKVLDIIARSIFILSLPALFISSSLAWGFNSLWLYEYGFQKYNVAQTTGLSALDLQKAATGLIHYFNSRDEYVNITVEKNGVSFGLFNTEEQIHFKDVKALVWLDYKVGIVSLILAAGYILAYIFWSGGKYRTLLARRVLWGSGVSLLLILILGIASLLDFDQLFLQFHELVFTNSYWSASGYMLMLFPGGFWYDAALICSGFTAACALISGALSLLYLRINRLAAHERGMFIRRQRAPGG
jgi:integral membrane protein (TIGR01906 family)